MDINQKVLPWWPRSGGSACRQHFFTFFARLERLPGPEDRDLVPDPGEETVGRVVRVPVNRNSDSELIEFFVVIAGKGPVAPDTRLGLKNILKVLNYFLYYETFFRSRYV